MSKPKKGEAVLIEKQQIRRVHAAIGALVGKVDLKDILTDAEYADLICIPDYWIAEKV